MINLNSMLTSKGSQNTGLATHHVAVTEKFMLTCCYRPGCHHHCTRRADQYHHPHGTMEDLLLCNFLFQKWISTLYISRVNGWPCGKQLSSILIKVLRTVSTLNTGTNYSYELLTSLKGSKKSKLKLWHDKPELHAYFQGKSEHWAGNSSCGCYWKVHVDLLLPTWVPPPLYQKGRPVSPPTWYHGGPSVMQLPLPKVDIHTDYGEICRCHL